MKRLFKYLKTVNRHWLYIWIAIYVTFMVLGALEYDFIGVTIIKYLGIVLCLIYAWIKFPKDHLLFFAMFFAVVADLILIFDNSSTLGVFAFCIVQFLHIIRISTARFSLTPLIVYVFVILCVISAGLILNLPPIYSVASVYAATIITNLYLAYRWYKVKHNTPATCAWYGFLLFFICDVFVMLSFFSSTGVLSSELTFIFNYFAWTFYYPSQVLISNSSKENLPKNQKAVL